MLRIIIIVLISLYGISSSSSWGDDGSDTDFGDVCYKEAEIVDMTALDGNLGDGEIDDEMRMVNLKILNYIFPTV